MDFNITEKERMFQNQAKEFAQKKVRPRAQVPV